MIVTIQTTTEEKQPFVCEVCGVDISMDWGRCTNSRCNKCHHLHCVTSAFRSELHGRGIVATPFQRKLERNPC